MMKNKTKQYASFFGHSFNETMCLLLCLLSTPPFHFIVCERQEMSPVSVSGGVEAPTSTSEPAYIVYERQRTQQSATERRATATKRVASVPMPPLNRHLISLDRTAVAD